MSNSRLATAILLGLLSFWCVASDWPVHGADKAGTRYSRLDQIDRRNVEDLTIAWQYRTGERARRGEQAFKFTYDQDIPILVAGNLVVCTPFNRVIALNPATGIERWVFEPQIALNHENGAAYGCRGVAHWRDEIAAAGTPCRDRLLFGTNDLRMFAIDARTGKRCSDFGDNGEITIPTSKPEAFRGEVRHLMPPAIVNGVAVLGSAIVDDYRADTPSGKVRAFDAKTGARRWEFDPLRTPQSAAATDGTANQIVTGSANVWSNMSVDEDRDLIFLPTSSPAPDFYGGLRPGNNEFANSLVALRGTTGEYLWHFQVVHHTVWDYDLAPQPLLVDLPRDGEAVPVVVQNTKQGLVFIFNRETGEPFFAVEERPVPKGDLPGEWYSPTQPFPVKPPPLLKLHTSPDDAWGFTFWDQGKCRELMRGIRTGSVYTPPSLEGTLISPWTAGGANWGGPAYDPQRSLMIINTSRIAKISKIVPVNEIDKLSATDLATYGEVKKVGTSPYAVQETLLVSPWGAPCTPPPWGALTAVDLAKGTIVWEVALGSIEEFLPLPIPWRLGTPNIGGPIITAGGLIFIAATIDRNFRAFDVDSGEELWRDKLPATTLTTPMTYFAGGRQFVVIVSGGHSSVPSVKGDYVIAYALPH